MYSNYFEWLDFWNGFYKKAKVKPNTYKNSCFYVNILKRHTLDIALDLIDETYCQSILLKMYDEGYSKGTIKKIATILRQSLGKAEKLAYILKNPCTDLIIPQANVKKVLPLSQEEQILVEGVCSEEALGHLVIFMLYTGLRRGELINLQWNNYDQESHSIQVTQSKTENGIRTVPLLNIAQKIICDQRAGKNDNYIFHGLDGKQLTNSAMRELYKRIRLQTGIESFTNHVCRHTFATRLVEKKASPKSVATLLGHAKVEYALNIYAELEKKFIIQEIHLLESNA
ncbi:site-specific integrase (plasmid) [Oscillospiraceae bacterium MB08-C2-2]|nr:site-specific integrase [Oscillospiraceae bacterium MB08-C2-2]